MSDNNINAQTADLLSLADVKRWITVRTARSQNVAEHSFGVAVIAANLCVELGLTDDEFISRTLWWSLVHDLPEVLTGDIDGKFKRLYPLAARAINVAELASFPEYERSMADVSDKVKVVVKTADRIETILFIHSNGMGRRAIDSWSELDAIFRLEWLPEADKALPGIQAYAIKLLNVLQADNINIQSRNPWTVGVPRNSNKGCLRHEIPNYNCPDCYIEPYSSRMGEAKLKGDK